jgi:hypothetical protein
MQMELHLITWSLVRIQPDLPLIRAFALWAV